MARHLGLLLGPAIGGGLLYFLGPSYGLMVNASLFLPLVAWLLVTPYTGHLREGLSRDVAKAGVLEAVRVLREVAENRTILAMIGLAGFSSLLVGSAFQPQMPQFAEDLGADNQGLLYSALLAAHGAGAAAGGTGPGGHGAAAGPGAHGDCAGGSVVRIHRGVRRGDALRGSPGGPVRGWRSEPGVQRHVDDAGAAPSAPAEAGPSAWVVQHGAAGASRGQRGDRGGVGSVDRDSLVAGNQLGSPAGGYDGPPVAGVHEQPAGGDEPDLAPRDGPARGGAPRGAAVRP